MNVDARVEALETEAERLRDRIAQLEDAMGMNFLTPIEWRLTGSEARVFGVLMSRELATKHAIMAALYDARGADEAEIKIVDVFICKMRPKLKAFGIEIGTRWGEGYYLSAPMKALARGDSTESAAEIALEEAHELIAELQAQLTRANEAAVRMAQRDPLAVSVAA